MDHAAPPGKRKSRAFHRKLCLRQVSKWSAAVMMGVRAKSFAASRDIGRKLVSRSGMHISKGHRPSRPAAEQGRFSRLFVEGNVSSFGGSLEWPKGPSRWGRGRRH